MAWSFMRFMCSCVITWKLPVAETKMSRLVGGVVHGDHPIAFHRRLQRADRIDLGDPHLRRERAQRLRRALADIAVARHHRDFAGDHDVGGALDAIDQDSRQP